MSKINKVESFNLESLLNDSNFLSGNVFYDANNPNHAPHIDLHVKKTNGQKFDYRLYNPPEGDIFNLNPNENFIIKK